MRTRPLSVGYLRTLEAVARHLNFRAAADELAMTQSAVSRQIQALEEELGSALFARHTRSVELTAAGEQLLRATVPSIERIDSAVRMIRTHSGRKVVSITTWASFATMWLIPRLEAFQSEYPDIDIRIDATDSVVDLESNGVDIALRHTHPKDAPAQATLLFSDQFTPVASPWLLQGKIPLRTEADLARHTLIEAGGGYRTSNLEWLTWRRWLDTVGQKSLEPKRWLYFNYAHQIVQAALTGQGVALARLPLIADSLASGDLVEVLPQHRRDSPMAYYLVLASKSSSRPEIQAFADWLLEQARKTCITIGQAPVVCE